ncbi:TPA: hypothetical protein N0F65_011019 [Lagenidium giganteum]|uniref:Post-GPI attachment to proteins factor 3 n=1 Tax=Lagenidium giganteum TaxID=4803 RepID=A0AAV2ZAX1_9STRA|nr:TPA: hypothetical protein N0F65_011019 [Lagenidium giganteum]
MKRTTTTTRATPHAGGSTADNEMHPILPPQYSARLFRSSFTTSLSVAMASYHRLWLCAALALMVLATSLNYWRHPVRGWRRNVDMAAVFMGMSHHIYYSSYVTDRTYQAFYLLLVAKTMYCYSRARKAHCKNTSSAWHCTMHIIGNIANMLLYTGLGGAV